MFKGAQVWDFDLLDSNDLRAEIKILHFLQMG
jgi:hypothetical protein